jgi:signal transduction histidine kinase
MVRLTPMRRRQLKRTALMTVASVAAAVVMDYLINVVLMPGVTPYTPWGTVVTAGLISLLSWWFVIGQRLALQETRDRLVATLAARDAAEAASAAKSQFLNAMSHELRTPLNAIIGYSEIMAETAEEEARAADIADHGRVLGSARHLLRMVDDVLELSGLEAGDVAPRAAPFNVQGLARMAMQRAGPAAAAHGNTLRLAIAPDVGAACTDAQRLARCLDHLLANAARFTQNGEVALSVRRRDEDLVFTVADTGCGIAPEHMGRLFQTFSQVDSSVTRTHGGAGVGLALTRGIARLLGGDVTAVSTPGRGSVFTLTAPAIYRTAHERAADAGDARVVAMRAA